MILFFQDKDGISKGYLYHLQRLVQSAGFNISDLMMIDIYGKVPDAVVAKRSGGGMKFVVQEKLVPEIKDAIDGYIQHFNPKVIVCNDEATLRVFSGEKFTRSQARGSVFHYSGIPVIVVDRIQNVNRTNHGYWVAQQDWAKIGRWYRGEQYHEPSFEYIVCLNADDLLTLRETMAITTAIAVDIETIDNWISCIGYCCLLNNGKLITYVIPLWNPTRLDGCHWSEADELIAWETIRLVNDSTPFKILQNGAYDSAYLIKYRAPLRNYYIDTQYAWWAIYCELPRRLDFIASICLDYVTFWKEEVKGDAQTKLAYTDEMVEKFWRYNALDCYYTMLCSRVVLALLSSYDWARRNYNAGFRIQIGPALAMSCRGFLHDTERMSQHRFKWEQDRHIARGKIAIMVDDADFNPASSKQCCELMYDVLGAQEVKIKGKLRSSDEDHLKACGYQHPLFKVFSDVILACREPQKMLDDYGEHRLVGKKWKGIRIRGKRMHFSLNACKTITSRFASSKWMWEGTNGQNIPGYLRDILQADPGMLLFEADFRQSDAWFVAHHSGDPRMLENLASGRDLHTIHAEAFFKESYEVIHKGIDDKDPKYMHEVTGIRQISKKIGHGCNYWMQARTLYFLMGKDAVLAAASAIGIKDPWTLDEAALIAICNRFIIGYYNMYEYLEPWADRLIEMIRVSSVITEPAHGFTRVFFGDTNNQKMMREAASQIGQGGTAGNINRVVDEVYFGINGEPSLEEQGLHLLLQGHDSLIGQVPREKPELIQKMLDIMEKPCKIGDVTFKVPTDCKVGSHWGKDMVKFERITL